MKDAREGAPGPGRTSSSPCRPHMGREGTEGRSRKLQVCKVSPRRDGERQHRQRSWRSPEEGREGRPLWH